MMAPGALPESAYLVIRGAMTVLGIALLGGLPAAARSRPHIGAGEVASAFDLLAEAERTASGARLRVSEADALVRATISLASPRPSALSEYIAQRKQRHDRLAAECDADKLAIQSLEALRTPPEIDGTPTLEHGALEAASGIASPPPLVQEGVGFGHADRHSHSWRAGSATRKLLAPAAGTAGTEL